MLDYFQNRLEICFIRQTAGSETGIFSLVDHLKNSVDLLAYIIPFTRDQ